MTVYISEYATLTIGGVSIALSEGAAARAINVRSASPISVMFEMTPENAASLVAFARLVRRREAAIARFRRAMRRHEKRARRMGLHGLVAEFDVARRMPDREQMFSFSSGETWARTNAREGGGHRDMWRRAAFLYSLAADAVAKLRSAA